MNDDIAALYAYNRWADRKIVDACQKLSPEQYTAEPAPGWSSVRSTLTHIAIVTDGWLRGCGGEEVTSFPTEADLPTVEDSERLLDRAYETFERLRPSLSSDHLATLQTFRGAGRSVTLPPWMVFRHIVNHATYHRGQIASKLRRFGVEPPMTDLIFWAVEQIPQKG
jgi:uncharacterized damage-inducible protein DinB